MNPRALVRSLSAIAVITGCSAAATVSRPRVPDVRALSEGPLRLALPDSWTQHRIADRSVWLPRDLDRDAWVALFPGTSAEARAEEVLQRVAVLRDVRVIEAPRPASRWLDLFVTRVEGRVGERGYRAWVFQSMDERAPRWLVVAHGVDAGPSVIAEAEGIAASVEHPRRHVAAASPGREP